MSKIKKNEDLDFEKSVERLNQIVEKMEKGDIPLEQSLQYFEEGIALIRSCQKTLAQAEQKVEILMKEQGKDVLKNYKENSEE